MLALTLWSPLVVCTCAALYFAVVGARGLLIAVVLNALVDVIFLAQLVWLQDTLRREPSVVAETRTNDGHHVRVVQTFNMNGDFFYTTKVIVECDQEIAHRVEVLCVDDPKYWTADLVFEESGRSLLVKTRGHRAQPVFWSH